PLVPVEAAGLAVLIFHRVCRDDALPRTDAADAADAALIVADDMLVHDETLLAVLAGDDARRPVAERGIHVVVPEIERLEDMSVSVDDVVSAAHQHFSGAGFRSCGILAQRPLRRKLNVVQNPERCSNSLRRRGAPAAI